MKAIDMHCHWTTKTGSLWRTPQEIAMAEEHHKIKILYKTEEGMAEDLRKADVKAVMDYSFTMVSDDYGEVKDLHDYVGQFKRDYPDVVLGWWVSLDPRKDFTLREFERCLKDQGAMGFAFQGTTLGMPPTDRVFNPIYEMCCEAKAPVLIHVGYTADGAGFPGGGGRILEHCHPRYLDEVAARFPGLQVIAGRTAFPWEREMIAIMLHKPNVWMDVHGWLPRYFAPELKYDINRRLQDKVTFGADYPIYSYDTLFGDWESGEYKPEVLEKVYLKNAQRLLHLLGRDA
ncbi:MAG: amidohydrolase [Chloroflexota bacterium]|nr:MAG: amidohydrolase [Chloroflexota bacterium]